MDGTGMDMSVTDNDWTTPEYLANIAAGELRIVLELLGVRVTGCHGTEDGDVSVSFHDIRDAETMVSLGVVADARPGTMYDRATACCVTIGQLVTRDVPPSDDDLADALDAGWAWNIHPDMAGRRMDWHASVVVPHTDATQLVANLNAVRRVTK